MWGKDSVHPSDEAYAKIAAFLEGDLADTGAKYTNPPVAVARATTPRVDLSLHREEGGGGERVPGSTGQK
jgi:hypothetical protein